MIVELISESRGRARLSNGHRLVAHLGRKEQARGVRLACGDRVELELAPYDLSQGRVAAVRKAEET